MIKVGTLAKIPWLHLREGVPIEEIERRTGLARNMIKTWLRKGEMVESKNPARIAVTKLDGYTDTLASWLKACAGECSIMLLGATGSIGPGSPIYEWSPQRASRSELDRARSSSAD